MPHGPSRNPRANAPPAGLPLSPALTSAFPSRRCVARSCRAKPEIWLFKPRSAAGLAGSEILAAHGLTREMRGGWPAEHILMGLAGGVFREGPLWGRRRFPRWRAILWRLAQDGWSWFSLTTRHPRQAVTQRSLPLMVRPPSGWTRGWRRRSAPASDFEEFWAAFPCWRENEKKCREEFDRILMAGRATAEEIVAGANRYGEDVRGEDPQFIARRLNWLTAERWRDEPRPKGKRQESPWLPPAQRHAARRR